MWKNLSVFDAWLDPLWLRRINKTLTVILAVLIVLWVADFLLISPKREWSEKISRLSERPPDASSPASQPAVASVTKEIPKEISTRNIFSAAPVKETTATQSSLNNLVLVGIISGQNPRAVLEDMNTQVTYYLAEDQIFNGMTVEEIQEKKVIMKHNNESVTFNL